MKTNIDMSEKKKILYLITQSELGGAQRYVFDLAENLRNDFEITVAFGEPGESGDLAKMLKEKNVVYHILPHLKRAISPLNDLLALLEIIKLFKKMNPDIIHLNSSKISILGSIASVILKIKFLNWKLIYTVHGWVFNEPLPHWQKTFYFWAEKITARWKDVLICVSEFDRQSAIKNKIAPEEKLATVHNGIPAIDLMVQYDARKILIEKFNFKIEPGEIVIGSIGNLYKTKGYEHLIRSLKILADKNIKFKTIIIGDGQERHHLVGMAKENGLANQIIFGGQAPGAARYLAAFDLYVNSSVKEGLSYTIIEAMQAGLPIAATDVGGTSELINDGRTGLLVKPADIFALADAMEKLINDSAFSKQLGEQARQKAQTEFTLTAMIEKTKQVYS